MNNCSSTIGYHRWNGKMYRKHKLPELTQEDIENVNKPIKNKNNWISIQNSQQGKFQIPGVYCFISHFMQHLKKKIYTSISQTFPINSIVLPSWFQNQTNSPIQKLYRSVSFCEYRTKFFSIILKTWAKQNVKRIIYHNQIEFILGKQEIFNIRNTINVIYHTK